MVQKNIQYNHRLLLDNINTILPINPFSYKRFIQKHGREYAMLLQTIIYERG
jgi:hypothetical protein